MRLRLVPVESGSGHRAGEHGLAICKPAEGGGIETAERMKRVALVTGALDRGIDKAEVEMGIVADENGALAAGGAQGLPHGLEEFLQRLAFVDGPP